MGGFFRSEIKSAADLAGLKIRAGGLAGRVLQKLGAVPAADAARRDRRGAADRRRSTASPGSAPTTTPRSTSGGRLQKVAPFYYYPGWWRGGSMVHVVFNKAKYDALPEPFRAALRTAALATQPQVLAAYDAANPAALKQLVIAGAELRAFPQDLLEAAFKAAERGATGRSRTPTRASRPCSTPRLAFRADQYLWWQVSEYTFDNFMIRQRARG